MSLADAPETAKPAAAISPKRQLARPSRVFYPCPMTRLFPLPLLFLLVLASTRFLVAGTYSQDFSGFAAGTTNLNDGSELSSNRSVTSVRGNTNPYLRLTASGTPSTSSAFRLPDLDPGQAVDAFTVTFDLFIGGSGTLADGISLSFGDLPAGSGGGEAGFSVDDGLIIAWDTYDNGGDPPSVEIFARGTSLANHFHNYGATANRWVPVEITWDSNGLDLRYDGTALATDLPTPGLVPRAGDQFAFSARTGGLTQNSYLDNLSFTTSTARPIETGGPVITEFVASNEDGYEDEDLDHPDWLEIYNGQAVSEDLNGYFLTTDPALQNLWQIPALTLDRYEHLVIFASGKNRQLPHAPLHADFRLPREGGYLALIAPDGVTVVSEFTYPPQEEDIAYGTLGSDQTLGYLETPTPGRANRGLQAPGPPAEEVAFDRPGGVFRNSTNLTILPPHSPGALVRYTIDNSIPTENSPVYHDSLTIRNTTTIRARVFEEGRLPGEVKSRTLLALNSDVADFSSNLPIVVIDSNGVNIDLASNPEAPRPFRPVYTVVIDREEASGLARISGQADFTGRGGQHVRGQSSSEFPKKQYAWETWNNENEDKDVSLLGMPEESDWILYAPYSDKTLMRNALVYEAAREARGNWGGVRTRYVEVFFNSGGGPVSLDDYRGVYVLMEKIKRGADRVDVERLGDLTTDPEQIQGGYIFKKDKSPYSRPWTTAIERVLLDMHYPEHPNDAQFDFLRNHLNEMERALHRADFADPGGGYRDFLDPASFIDAHLFTEVFKDIDGYRISSFFSKTRQGKIKALPVWDFNLALGNANYLQGENPTGWYYPQVNPPDYYWYQRLFQDPEFELAYWDRFWELRHGLFSTSRLMATIDRHDAELEGPHGDPNAVTRNFEEWDVLGRYLWPNPGGYQSRTTHQAEIDWMKTWLTNRLAWIESQSRGTQGPATPPILNRYGGRVEAGFRLTMSEPNGWAGAEIFYTLDGSDPRPPPNPAILLVEENAPCEVLVPTIDNGGSELSIAQWTNPGALLNATRWISGRQGVGYERSSNNRYDPFFNVDVEAEMAGQNETCYIRLPFTLSSQAELDAISSLTLKMRYDDSFVAYLNGVEIVRDANAPATLSYNSGAQGLHDDDEAVQYLDFAVSSGPSSLRVGKNILAIHGLNRGRGSSDALWSCLLEARQEDRQSVSETATRYSRPLNLQRSMDLRARVYDGSQWSPLTRAGFSVDTVPARQDRLVISEIHYRPSSPSPDEIAAGFDTRGEFEFLELLNIDPEQTISLEGLQFDDGIFFDGFDLDLPVAARVLAPGERVLLVKNRAAFTLRHGPGNIAGEFRGSLRNEGERITLRGADGTPIRDFSYGSNFPWPVAAGNGSGFSLVLTHPHLNPDHSDPASWRSSVAPNGTPGGDDSQPFIGNPEDDRDGDGFSAFLEYALGSSDESSRSRPSLQLEPASGPEAEIRPVLSVRTNLAAIGVSYSLQASDDLVTWGPASDLSHVATDNHGDGTATMRFLPIDPAAPRSFRFYRVRVTASP